MKNIQSSIVLQNLELDIYLGWPEEERTKKQTISIDLKIRFLQPPKACETDKLDDTFCYDALTKAIATHITAQPVRLLEYLGHEIYHVTKKILKDNAQLSIRVTKRSTLANLKSGPSFCYGDEECVW